MILLDTVDACSVRGLGSLWFQACHYLAAESAQDHIRGACQVQLCGHTLELVKSVWRKWLGPSTLQGEELDLSTMTKVVKSPNQRG